MDAILDFFLKGGPLDPATAALSVTITFLMSLAIAWIHRRTFRGASYTQDFAHTLIIIAVVTTILIGVVRGSFAIGLGMFAAFSVIRFPRNLGQSSDLAFLFFAISIGMVSGTGHYIAAIALTVLIGGAVLVMYGLDAFAPMKASHLLTVNLASDTDFEEVLAPVFAEHTEESRLLNLNPMPEGDRTLIRYGLQLKPGTSVARLIESLHHACGNQKVVLMPTNQEFDVER